MKKTIAAVLCALLASGALTGCATMQADLTSALQDLTAEQTAAETEQDTLPETQTVDYPETLPQETSEPPSAAEAYVRPAEWAAVQWTQYQSELFTLTVPEGWDVQWQGDANQMQWMATSPDKTVGISNLDHCYAAKDANMKQALGFNLSMSNGTVREFFEAQFKDSTEYFTVQNSCVPSDKDLLQSVRPYTPIKDYQSLYATFKDSMRERAFIRLL